MGSEAGYNAGMADGRRTGRDSRETEAVGVTDAESQLVSQAAEGDRAAIQRLLTRHHDELVATIEANVPADLQGVLAAEDVCQDAYIAVYQQIGTLRDRTWPAFGSWLRAITERKLVDAIRRFRALKRGGGRRAGPADLGADVSSTIEPLDLVAVHQRTASRSVARHELVTGVQAALDQLKGDHREALRLHYIEGLSVAETARRMERTGDAVVMLCNRALRRLGSEIGDPARFLSRGT
jgi:RNA polymerase sigma-70 factor (ECF subfamily)